MLLTLSLLGLCLVSTPAEARELTSRERAYSRALGKLLDLKPKSTKGLTSKSGARGVQVRFLGLDVTRLHFRSSQAARRFVKRRSRERSGRQRVALKGQEILVLRGARLSNPAFATRAVKAGWDASVRSPSKPTKDGLLGPLDAKEAAEKARIAAKPTGKETPLRPAKPRTAGSAQPTRVAPQPTVPQPPAQEQVLPSTPRELQRAGVGPRGLTPIEGGPKGAAPRRAPRKPAAPRGFDLSGDWATLSRGRIAFRRTGYTKGADHYEVLCVDFDRPCPPLAATFSGRRLSLRSNKGALAEFLWVPSNVGGGRFVYLSGARDLLPGRTSAFWRAPKVLAR